MKRSEMIKKMIYLFTTKIEDDGLVSLDSIAEMALTEMESAGMLPPETTSNKPKFPGDINPYTDNSWDEEDEDADK